ncbi:MAG TPA: HAMP domain-containing sensor histidine kinase [Rhodanobacter sp.]|nr:HAMP domain-containing sensor histidine kinase [Rhodanobacter sp.]
MITRSLHWRLLVGAMAAILLALAVAWIFMTLLFERHLERRLQAEMTRDGLRLVAGLVITPGESPRVDRPPVDSRLETPAGGYYWEISTPAGTLRSRSLWDGDLRRPADAPADHWRLQRVGGPYGQAISILERRVELADGSQVLVQLALDVTPLASARAEFGRELAAFLAVLWLVLSAAAWLQVRLGLRPLSRVRGDLAALRASASARLPESRLREVQPLTDSINALADARERDLVVARQRAADLAHSLKTPLAAMAAQSRRARESGAGAAADGLDRAIAAIGHAIESELARARIAVIRRQPGGSASVHETVERLLTVLEQTDRGGELAFQLDVPASLRVAVQPEDLSEILGAVLENAVRYARRQVRISAAAGPEWASVSVEDDGPGIAAEHVLGALKRGGRLDEANDGSGLGLAIARELVEATGGTIAMSRSVLGGLKLDFCWGPKPAVVGAGASAER